MYKIKGFIKDILKNKPKFLKTSYLKEKFHEIIVNICMLDYYFFKTPKIKDKWLIVSFDALGDNIVKTTTIKIIADEIGKENLYILCRDRWEDIYKKLNYNYFILKSKGELLKKIKLYRMLNGMGFRKVIFFEHDLSPKSVKYLNIKEKIYVKKDVDYVLDSHILLLEQLFLKKYTINDIKPNILKLANTRKYSNIVTVAVGASARNRTLPIENMSKIIEVILKRYPDKEIYLLGNGSKQYKYANELLERISISNKERVINFVDKTDVIESISIINDSDYFVGYDSGLLNIAFALNKKAICLHWSEKKFVWEHPFPNIKTIKGNGKDPINDGYHGTPTLNSIKNEQIEEAFCELERL